MFRFVLLGIAVSLLVLTICFKIYMRFKVNKFAGETGINIRPTKIMQVFIDNDATYAQELDVKEELLKINGITHVEYVSKEEAYEEMEAILNSQEAIMNLKPDFMDASYRVYFSNLKEGEDIYNQIIKIDNVKKVTTSNQTYQTIARVYTIINTIIVTLNISIGILIFFIVKGAKRSSFEKR